MDQSTLEQILKVEGVSKYKVLSYMGNGRYSVAFLAKDKEKGQYRILKVAQDDSERTKEKFRKEYDILSSINHQNIIKAYGLYQPKSEKTVSKTPILVMENGGRSLDSIIQSQKISMDNFVSIISNICEALTYLHKKEADKERIIFHRDIKTSNILIKKEDKQDKQENAKLGVKLGDFTEAGYDVDFITSGGKVGTAIYKIPKGLGGPENRENLKRPEADIYSLGVVMYEILANKKLFLEAEDEDELIRLKNNGDGYIDRKLKDLKKERELGEDIISIIRNCIDRDPKYKSAAELKDALLTIGKKEATKKAEEKELARINKRYETFSKNYENLSDLLRKEKSIISDSEKLAGEYETLFKRYEEKLTKRAGLSEGEVPISELKNDIAKTKDSHPVMLNDTYEDFIKEAEGLSSLLEKYGKHEKIGKISELKEKTKNFYGEITNKRQGIKSRLDSLENKIEERKKYDVAVVKSFTKKYREYREEGFKNISKEERKGIIPTAIAYKRLCNMWGEPPFKSKKKSKKMVNKYLIDLKGLMDLGLIKKYPIDLKDLKL